MRLTVVQMNPGQDKSANIAQARGLIEAAIAEDSPSLITLPEMWSCLGGDRATKLDQAEALPPPGSNQVGSNQPGGPAYEFLRSVARKGGLHVHGGSICEREGDRLFNTTVVFSPDGDEIARYRKIHLFDITTPDGTGYRESATYGAGDTTVTFDLVSKDPAGEPMRLGCAICYDVRFPELFLSLRRAGAEVIFLPAAFTLQTGKDHWEPLIRARAIETQCWFAAAATWGRHKDGKGQTHSTYGHSLICDPWGQVVAKASDGMGWATARIDRALTARVRRDMPVLDHRVLA